MPLKSTYRLLFFHGIFHLSVKWGDVRENRPRLSPQGTDCILLYERREP